MGHILKNGKNSVTVYGAMKPVYVRTDRNGTKIYHDNNCPRCCGHGSLERWAFTGKTCFACGGSGLRNKPLEIKVYTDEYQEKLDARRAAREAKRLADNPPPDDTELRARADEAMRNTWEGEGFTRDGIGYVHYGQTYENRSAIQAAGGRWCRFMKAYVSPVRVERKGVYVREVRAQELCNPYGYIDIDKALELAGTL